jgi:putative ABC transport system permease protein
VQNVRGLVSKEFLSLVVIAFVIFAPVTWWAMHTWLENYEYQANISASVFAIAGIVTISIARITVSFQAIRAGLANPVKSLGTE